MRRAARTDDNHAEIRDAYRNMGCSVLDTFQIGNGAPDMFVAIGGVTDGVEVKDGKKPPSARRLTPDEERFHDDWRGNIVLVECLEDAVRHVNMMRQRAK